MASPIIIRLLLLWLATANASSRFTFRQTPRTDDSSKTSHTIRGQANYHHQFSSPLPINPLESFRRRRIRSREGHSAKEVPAESDLSTLPPRSPGKAPPLSSLQPLVDSVALRLTRLVTGGKSRFVDTELDFGAKGIIQTKVHLIDIEGTGSLPPVVLLHGITSCASDFAPLAHELRSKYSRIIAVDLLGHGLTPLPMTSEKPNFSWMTKTLTQVMDKCLPNQKAILLGNSMGGLIAMRTALERPDIVDGLFLISPAGGPLDEKQISSLSSIFHISSHEEGKEFIDLMHGQPPSTPMRHLMAWVARGRCSQQSVKKIFDSATSDSFMTEKDCQGITCPTALFWGGEEKVLPTDHLNFFRENIPQLSVCNPPFFGHVPQNDDWKFVAGRCAEFTRALHQEASGSVQRDAVESWISTKPKQT